MHSLNRAWSTIDNGSSNGPTGGGDSSWLHWGGVEGDYRRVKDEIALERDVSLGWIDLGRDDRFRDHGSGIDSGIKYVRR